MMDYKELVKRLRNVVGTRDEKCEGCHYEEDFPCCVDCLDKMHREAADAIEALSKMENTTPKWIPVTERLPETLHKVLVTLKSIRRPGAVYLNFATCENGTWYEDNGSEPFRIASDRVTHWMPLPEPQKEET